MATQARPKLLRASVRMPGGTRPHESVRGAAIMNSALAWKSYEQGCETPASVAHVVAWLGTHSGDGSLMPHEAAGRGIVDGQIDVVAQSHGGDAATIGDRKCPHPQSHARG